MSLRLILLVLVSLAAGLLVQAKGKQLYTCGMHPQIIQDHPGNCPICGMKLTPLHDDDTPPGAGITIDPETIQRMNLKTAVVARGPVEREIRAVGTVAYDESGLRDITLKYDGWIEELYVDTTATTVHAGDKLFRIYSPDLYNAELNYLVARRSEGGEDGPLTRAARTRLELYDLPGDAIAELAHTGRAERTYVYRAPADGIVTQKPVVVGRLVKAGELIYQLARLDPVWVVAQIYETDAPFVHAGQDAVVRATYGDTTVRHGKVELLEPQLADATRTLMARIVLPNPDAALRPGAYVDVRLDARIAADAVLVPADAVLRTGEHNTVFLALDGGRFSPREITLGALTADDRYQVLNGLEAGDRVVVSGQFMLDSESQLRAGIQKMIKAREETPAAAPAAAATSNDTLPALGAAVADAATALGHDDLAAYRQLRPRLQAAVDAYLAKVGDAGSNPLATFRHLTDGPDLAAVRAEFERLSTAVTDLVRADPAAGAGLHAFECPMAPVTGKARWLQHDAPLLNPFYGSAMPTCGDELR